MLAGKRRVLALAWQPSIAATTRSVMGAAARSSAESAPDDAQDDTAGQPAALQRWCVPEVPGMDELGTCDLWHALLSKEGYVRLCSFSGVRIRRWCSWRQQKEGRPTSASAVWCSPDFEEDSDPWAAPVPE
ncbi:rsmF [Symbiodinium natans]|uniref:RsmF protein n=1 Tax=Symbiodinium natans TaxID=878477 RepID=A0A812UTL3_9DINO|nr:rsmF [Symbiodinium natans]